MCVFLFQNVCLFLTTGDEQGAGMFLLVGTEQLLADVGPKYVPQIHINN